MIVANSRQLYLCAAFAALFLPGCNKANDHADSAPNLGGTSSPANPTTALVQDESPSVAAGNTPSAAVDASSPGGQATAPTTAATPKPSQTILGPNGVDSVRAGAFLATDDFDGKIREIALEGAVTPGSGDNVRKLHDALKSLTGAVDPNARLGEMACSAKLCAGTLNSRMDKAQWEVWQAEFDRAVGISYDVAMFRPTRRADGSTDYRILLVNDGNRGVSIPISSLKPTPKPTPPSPPNG